MKRGHTFRGVVRSGLGQGRRNMSAPGVLERLQRLTGQTIYPGTLNVYLSNPFHLRLPNYVTAAELAVETKASGFHWAPIIIADKYPGLLVRSTGPGSPPNLVGLVSNRNLRQALGLRDGDEIEFTLIGD